MDDLRKKYRQILLIFTVSTFLAVFSIRFLPQNHINCLLCSFNGCYCNTRNKDKREIDLLIEKENTLYPIEIKKHADPSVKDIAAFSVLDKLGSVKRGSGGVICLYDHLVTLKGEDRVIPVRYL